MTRSKSFTASSNRCCARRILPRTVHRTSHLFAGRSASEGRVDSASARHPALRNLSTSGIRIRAANSVALFVSSHATASRVITMPSSSCPPCHNTLASPTSSIPQLRPPPRTPPPHPAQPPPPLPPTRHPPAHP